MSEPQSPEDPLSSELQLVLIEHTRAQAALARSLGIRRGDVDALEHLMAGPLGPGELARRLGVSPGAVSQLVVRLEARSHAVRTDDPDDARRSLVTLTEEGRATVLDHVMPLLLALDRLAATLGVEQREAVLTYLQGSRRAMAELAEPAQES